MFFSVIVPVYNVEEYLSACVESVLSQTFADFELILVDDGSPDACPAMCDAYQAKDSRVRVVHKPNGGLASARRAGIQVATGEYVFNLDSDDRIELDTLETAYKIITETQCEIVSFAYRWVKGDRTVSVTNDCIDEGLYDAEGIKQHIYPRLLMYQNMDHVSYYLSGKAVKRALLTPHQLGVDERISLGEDLCCVVPCYLHATSVYISKKAAYLYTVRGNSLSKAFNAKQIFLVENVIGEICKNDMSVVTDFEEQLCRYSCFMCFAILATAAEGNFFNSIKEIKANILQSVHKEKIARATFENISLKSRITVSLMQKERYAAAFYFLNFCKNIRKILGKG